MVERGGLQVVGIVVHGVLVVSAEFLGFWGIVVWGWGRVLVDGEGMELPEGLADLLQLRQKRKPNVQVHQKVLQPLIQFSKGRPCIGF